MKTQVFNPRSSFKAISFIGIMIVSLFAFNQSYGQQTNSSKSEISSNERIIKGIVSDEDGPLVGVNVIQKGTKTGTVTNEKGEFTFPQKLKTGDILLFSYLGYETQSFKIENDTSFIKLDLTADLIEMIGALDTNKPYKSKRKKT